MAKMMIEDLGAPPALISPLLHPKRGSWAGAQILAGRRK